MATPGSSPRARATGAERGHSEQVTGSLERVSAGDEHEAEIAEVRDAAFPIALRGYEREAVDAYVKRVNRLIRDLEASRSPDAAIRRALDRVGEETSGILQRAQETANEITERSRASADDRISEAEREARDLTEEAEDRVRELEADYGEIWARRDRLLDEVRDLAERLLATADDAADRLPTREYETGRGGADTDPHPQLSEAEAARGGAPEPDDPADLEDEEDTTVTMVEDDAGEVAPPDPAPAEEIDFVEPPGGDDQGEGELAEDESPPKRS